VSLVVCQIHEPGEGSFSKTSSELHHLFGFICDIIGFPNTFTNKIVFMRVFFSLIYRDKRRVLVFLWSCFYWCRRRSDNKIFKIFQYLLYVADPDTKLVELLLVILLLSRRSANGLFASSDINAGRGSASMRLENSIIMFFIPYSGVMVSQFPGKGHYIIIRPNIHP